MTWKRFDFSDRGQARVFLLTAVGTIFCIVAAYGIDWYSHSGWGPEPTNNLIIPLILAPPFFYYLLSKLRELAIARDELMIVASTDALTACLNRRAFTTLVDAYLERIARHDEAAAGALLVIDVDFFKTVNDRFGHAMGDEALKVVSAEIKAMVRDIDLVGRIGGEEFSVFLPGTDLPRAEAIAERIRTAISNAEFMPYGDRFRLTVSVGGATFERQGTFSTLFHLADQRLYRAKQNGRNRIDIRDPVPLRLVVAG